MVASKRERFLAIGVAAIVGVFALDRLVVGPLSDQWKDLNQKVEAAEKQKEKALKTFKADKQMKKRWAQLAGATLKTDASDADSPLLHNVREWGQDAGLEMSSVKPERAEKEKGFDRLTYRVTAAGGMRQLSQFLYEIESSNVPVRVTDVTINSRKDGTDDLSLVLGLSTIYHAPGAKDAPTGGGPAAAARQNREELQ